jgi:hypothetical protein
MILPERNVGYAVVNWNSKLALYSFCELDL